MIDSLMRPKMTAVMRNLLRGQQVRYYRLYFIDVLGHIEDVRECIAADDAAAIAEAQRLEHGNVIEVWCQGKKVTDVPPGAIRRHG